MNKKQLELTLKMIPTGILSNEDKQMILNKTDILFEFNNFMCDKHNINDEQVEALGKVYIETRAKNGDIDELCDLYTDFAKSEKFPKANSITESMKALLTIFSKMNQ